MTLHFKTKVVTVTMLHISIALNNLNDLYINFCNAWEFI